MAADSPRGVDVQEADSAALPPNGERDRLLELAEQLGHVGHWRVSLPDGIVSWSAEVYRIHGVTPDDYAPTLESAIGFYHPEDRDAVQAAIATAQSGQPFEFSLRIVRAGGELRYVKSRGLTIAGSKSVPALIFGVFLDVTEQRKVEDLLHEMNRKLEQIAYKDALTGLANRRQFDDTLEREWRRAIREQTPLSLIMLDIDRFKKYNDLYGHLAGDDCLRAVATAVAQVVQRPGDLVARYGGEEFALILPVTEAAGAEKIAQAVRSAILLLSLAHAGNGSCGGLVTASVGVSTAYPQSGAPATAWLDLIAEADALLYEAKRAGRNRVVSPSSIDCDGAAPLPSNEAARLATLAAYDQAGATMRSADFDRIARLAATLTSSPIGLVSLVDKDRQRFAGNYGLEGMEGSPRDMSFCAHAILGDEPMVVPDATRDSRFEESALVTGELGLRYYAGAPIISEATGHVLGTVCIVDRSSRAETTPADRALLTDLAKMAAKLIEDKAKLHS